LRAERLFFFSMFPPWALKTFFLFQARSLYFDFKTGFFLPFGNLVKGTNFFLVPLPVSAPPPPRSVPGLPSRVSTGLSLFPPFCRLPPRLSSRRLDLGFFPFSGRSPPPNLPKTSFRPPDHVRSPFPFPVFCFLIY